MTFDKSKRLAGAIAILLFLASAPGALAQTTSLEMDIAIDDSAVLDVSVDNGTVDVVGDDVDHVSIRARIKVDDRLTSVDPIKAGSIAGAIKRSPPIHADGDHIKITSLKKRTHQRYVTMAYEIVVPRDSSVTVHSSTGNVTVSGVSGPVEATSDSGEVTVAARPAARSASGS
jgi:hypothetical protein